MSRSKYMIIFLLSAMMLTVISCGKTGKGDSDAEKSREKLVETGQIAAINTRSFVLQRYGRYWYQMRVIGILEHGSLVNEGDSIIQLDPTDIQKFIIDQETNLETQMANLEKLYVEQANQNSEKESSIKSEIASFNLKKIELEASRFESERTKRIKELQFKQAEITLEKEKRKRELSKIIQENDLKIQKIRVQQIKTEIDNAYNILPRLTIRTSVSGVFQISHNWQTGGLVKVGDNIYTGNNMANVPELRQMKVETQINENDFLKIHTGQKVAVRLDAMPQIIFNGEITYIGKLCRIKEPKSRQKIFDVEVVIKDSDERLKPGMTVSCEFLED